MVTTRTQLLDRIDAFLARQRMSARQFGLAAVADHRFVLNLRRGAGVTLTIIERAERFMDERETAATGENEAAA